MLFFFLLGHAECIVASSPYALLLHESVFCKCWTGISYIAWPGTTTNNINRITVQLHRYIISGYTRNTVYFSGGSDGTSLGRWCSSVVISSNWLITSWWNWSITTRRRRWGTWWNCSSITSPSGYQYSWTFSLSNNECPIILSSASHIDKTNNEQNDYHKNYHN